jgi:anthranilate/para-aminobenzoate synthase component II
MLVCFLCLFSPFTAGRYHSLVIEKESFPGDELQITAWTEDGLVMAARHKKYKHLQVRYCSSFFHLLCAEGEYLEELMRVKVPLA